MCARPGFKPFRVPLFLPKHRPKVVSARRRCVTQRTYFRFLARPVPAYAVEKERIPSGKCQEQAELGTRNSIVAVIGSDIIFKRTRLRVRIASGLPVPSSMSPAHYFPPCWWKSALVMSTNLFRVHVAVLDAGAGISLTLVLCTASLLIA